MKKVFMPHTEVALPSFSHIKPLEPFDPKELNTTLPAIFKAEIKQSGKDIYDDVPLTLFDLSSHLRAREAIEFGLLMRDKGFHVFVLGEDRSGRMASVMSYLKQYMRTMPAPHDWVYLNNFKQPHQPIPFSFEAGKAFEFKERLAELMEKVQFTLTKTFSEESYVMQLSLIQEELQNQLNKKIDEVQAFALENKLRILQGDDGFTVEPIITKHRKKLGDTAADTSEPNGNALNVNGEDNPVIQEIKDAISKIEHMALEANLTIAKKAQHLSIERAKKKLTPLFQRFRSEHTGQLAQWVDQLKVDILQNLPMFASINGEQTDATLDPDAEPFYMSERYQVNILTDNRNVTHGTVVLESTPGYEQLFGTIQYAVNANGAHETNFTMIRKGALHAANNGVLVLRAEGLAKDPEVWEYLKSALRDREIPIEERYRERSMPLLNAPKPLPIPLDVQVFLIASPHWYYNFFFHDPEFKSYFKIKADIEEDMPATAENITIYRRLLQHNAYKLTGKTIEEDALDYIISYSTRWAQNRHRLSAKFEQIADVLMEANVLNGKEPTLQREAVKQAIHMRRERNARTEDQGFEDILSGQILIDTQGVAIGQVNGLSVLNTGDHQFGTPARISARSYAGDAGVLNIERMTEMAGPIQQKGAMILEGFLNGLLAQNFPLSYSCSLTFEQSYVDVDGDSASMAEVIAILSSLSGIPVRQDLAITGSMNQFGIAQPIGGTHFKVEGFHKTCANRGLTGTQGVIIPKLNLVNLTLRENIIEDIQAGKFFIWPVTTVFEAIEIMLQTPPGVNYNEKGAISDEYPFYTFSKGSVLKRAEDTLRRYCNNANESFAKETKKKSK